MAAFFVRQRRLLIVLLALIAWLAAFRLWHNETFGLPLDEPITLSPTGAIDRLLRIRLDAPHQIRLVFSFGSRPREEAMRLVGSRWMGRNGKQEEPFDVGVPLRWSLDRRPGHVVWSGESEAHGLYAYGTADAFRNVASMHLPAGQYRFTAAILRDVPEFQGMTARLQLGLPGGKTSSGWQSDMALFGAYANALVIEPLIGSFTMIMIGLGLRDWVRARRV